MTCRECNKLNDVIDLSRPYVVRTCMKCGRKIKLRTPGAHGIGIKIDKGDSFVMPAGFLTVSANPLKGSGHLTAYGLSLFAEMVFGVDIASQKKRENFPVAIRKIVESSEGFFKDAIYLKGLDLSDPANEDEVFKRVNANTKTVEWWGLYGRFVWHGHTESD